MIQRIYNGTSASGTLDASGLGIGEYAVLRGGAGDETMIGSNGNDRFAGGAGTDFMFGGAGNDQFFIARNNTVGGARDTIDGGTGSDELIITASTYQMTDTFKAELLRLNNFTILHGGASPRAFRLRHPASRHVRRGDGPGAPGRSDDIAGRGGATYSEQQFRSQSRSGRLARAAQEDRSNLGPI